MKKIFICFTFWILLNSCDLFQDDYEQFTNAYKKILWTRELYQNDTAKGNAKVNKIYQEYGFSEKTFRETYYDLVKKNPQEFQEILDSIRESTQRDITKYQIKQRKKRIREE